MMREYEELVSELRESAEWANRLAVLMGRDAGDSKAPLMRKAADAIEELLAAVPKWVSVRDVSDEEICAAKMVLSVIENLDKPMIMFNIEKSAVKKALLLMLKNCEAEPPKEVE